MGSSDSIFARIAHRLRSATNTDTGGGNSYIPSSGPPRVSVTRSPVTSNTQLQSRSIDRKYQNMNFATILPLVGQILTQTTAFIAGQAIVINIPAETAVLDLTAQGIGKVDITESGTTLSIKKAV